MPAKVKLKFKGNMDWKLEQLLINRGKFKVLQREGQHFMIVEKDNHKVPQEILINGKLPEYIKDQLIKRCMVIIHHFNEPHLHLQVIRMRIQNIAYTLPPVQKKFIEDWIDENLKEDQ